LKHEIATREHQYLVSWKVDYQQDVDARGTLAISSASARCVGALHALSVKDEALSGVPACFLGHTARITRMMAPSPDDTAAENLCSSLPGPR
jgi:hypothetical protein